MSNGVREYQRVAKGSSSETTGRQAGLAAKLRAFMARPSDIIVIGAGIVGCAVAYELARRGASVEIVDERPVGMGATQASAGVLAPYIEAREGSPLLALSVRSLGLFDDL